MKPSSHLLALLVIITPEDRTPDAVTASEARQSFLKTTRRTGDTHGVALKPPLAGWRGIRRVRALRVGLCQAAARREQRAADAQNIINSSAPITAKTDTTAGKLTAALKSLMDGSPVLFLLDDPFAPIPAIRQTAPNHERLHGEPQTRYWTSSCDQPQCVPAQRLHALGKQSCVRGHARRAAYCKRPRGDGAIQKESSVTSRLRRVYPTHRSS